MSDAFKCPSCRCQPNCCCCRESHCGCRIDDNMPGADPDYGLSPSPAMTFDDEEYVVEDEEQANG